MAHCIDRALERYGLQLRPQDLGDIQAQIEAGRSLLVRREHKSQVHAVRFLKKVLIAVYAPRPDNPDRWAIVTFLPPDAMTTGSARRHRIDRMKGEKMKRRPKVRYQF